MTKFLFAGALVMFLMFSVAGCGSGAGESGSTSIEGSETTTGSMTLAWDAPVNSDGTAVLNISGYKVHYGTSSGNYTKTLNTGTQTTCTINGLAPGTYYIAVTCYDSLGKESSFSNEASKTIQ
ncbi:MAG: fibronectin type III domain-containing protein [Geobacteraceae bacterium]|nr:fibronectin type III domain-containing protein [Geobacteraceae bacterium]